MIRSVWVAIGIAVSTLFFGSVAMVATALRIRRVVAVRHWATQRWARAILWASNTPVVPHGLDRVDWSAPQVLVANHLSGYDIFAIASILPAPFSFVGKKELERIPFFGVAWKAAGHISIDRSDRQSAVQSLRQAGEKMRRERTTVIIFPEGTRSVDGELQAFKKGAFVLALEAGVPVVPVVIRGSAGILESHPLRIRPAPIHLYFDSPVLPDPSIPDRLGSLMTTVRARMTETAAEID